MNIPQQSLAAIYRQANGLGHQLRNKKLRNKQLLEAAYYGNFSKFKNLLARGANINARNNKGWTALHMTAMFGRADIVKLLIDSGANINATDKRGNTALHWAGEFGHVEIVKALVIAGADVNVKNKYGLTALQMATKWSHYVKVQNAIEEGKTDLINLAKAIPMIAKHLEKPLIHDVITDIIGYANINKSQKIQAKKYMKARGIFYTEREEAAAATKIQAMARGNPVRK